MIKEFIEAIKAYTEAWKFIRNHQLWMYLLFPGLVNILLIVSLILSAIYFGDSISTYVLSFWLDEPGWLASFLEIFLSFSIRLILVYIYTLVYKNLILIFVSPMLALLSEKVESIKTGKSYPFVWKQFLWEVFRGAMIATRNLIKEIVLVSLCTLLLGIVSPFLIFLIESYYFGFSMMDYYNERKKLSVKESIRYIRRHRGMALGNGLVFYLLFLIPFIGWMIAPALGLVAATLVMLKSEETHTFAIDKNK